jgi:hypothetical protein
MLPELRRRIAMKTQISTAVTPSTRQAYDALIEHTGKSLTELLTIAAGLLEQHFQHYDPQLLAGYIQIARYGDLGPDAECPECGQAFGGLPFVRLHGDGTLSGPICARCASSE